MPKAIVTYSQPYNKIYVMILQTRNCNNAVQYSIRLYVLEIAVGLLLLTTLGQWGRQFQTRVTGSGFIFFVTRCSLCLILLLGSTWVQHYISCRNILSNHYLWSPYGIGQTIIFSSCFLLLLSSFFFFFLFFPRLISAVGDWMFTILWHMVWPGCEFRMQV